MMMFTTKYAVAFLLFVVNTLIKYLYFNINLIISFVYFILINMNIENSKNKQTTSPIISIRYNLISACNN